MTCCRARVTATLSRRSPPDWLSGPKFSGSTPWSSGLNAVENRITSRSSPWTFSRFFTNRPSGSSNASSSRGSPVSRSSASTYVRCGRLNVTTPIDGVRSGDAANRRTISATTASASTGLVRVRLRSNRPSTRTSDTPVPARPGAGNVASAPS